MNTTLIYLLQVNVGIILFYLFYRLFFAGDTFWKTRRAYLMLSIAASFIYPFLSIEGWLSQPEPMQTALVHVATLPEIVITPALPAYRVLPIGFWLIAFYLLVSVGFAVRFFVQLGHIARMRLIGKAALWQGQKIIVIDRETTPFSFFGAVFLNPASHTEAEIEQIMSHELTHVRQWHSVDVLIGEVLSIAFWFNPAVWLMKREIRQNLEFLADHQVLRSGFDTKNYQYHLLQLSYQSPVHKLGNQFNVSPLKKRIMMMNKQKTNKAAVLKYLLIVPLVLSLVLVANAQTVVKKTKKVVTATAAGAASAKPDSLKVTTKKASKFSAPATQQEAVTKTTDEPVFDAVEKMPQYPGGEKELMSYLGRNIRYPQAAQKANVEGKVFVSFVVGKDGVVKNPKILRGVAKKTKAVTTDQLVVVGYGSNTPPASNEGYESGAQALDQEALRVVNAMPQWIPGEQKGKKVAVHYVLPIFFKLDGDVSAPVSHKAKADNETPGADKLYLIDGKEVSEADVKALKTDRIQSVTVLKDASATAIYGAKGANGVVIVVTKK